MTRIAVNGAAGKMGQRILALARESGKFEVAGAFDNKEDRAADIRSLSVSALTGKGVLIDFSSSAGTASALAAVLKAGWGLVVGTTGLNEKERESIKDASRHIPVVFSSNMSVGVNVMLGLLREASSKLPKDFVISITEAHHIHKKDAPSGTALTLAKEIASSRPMDIAGLLKAWEAGKFDEKGEAEKIGMKVIREGEIVGEHTVRFEGPAETIEITHKAQSRDTFAGGALVAARFAATAKPGLYSMADVLKV